MKPILTLAIILAASVAHAAAYRIPDGSILAHAERCQADHP